MIKHLSIPSILSGTVAAIFGLWSVGIVENSGPVLPNSPSPNSEITPSPSPGGSPPIDPCQSA